MTPRAIEDVVRLNYEQPGGLVAVLQEIQRMYGYLPEEALRDVSAKTGRPLVDIYEVATFYRAFRLKPRGEHVITVCLGTACHVRSAPGVVEEFERRLGVSVGDTTEDGAFTLETVNCLGSCSLGPVVVIDGRYFVRVTQSKVPKLLKKAREGLDAVDLKGDRTVFPITVRCPRCNHSLMDRRRLIDEHPSIKFTVSFNRHHGWIRLSSLYGSYNLESEFEIPRDTIVQCFCPHCHLELAQGGSCPDCSLPMVVLIVEAGGVVQLCVRRGCKGHMLDLNNIAM
ncbi:MAG: NADH-quinone oxidoreductase subunit NuoE family protein [Planctomycetota bacterium]|jgi:NADH-quinone oxidoreductase subunit E